MKIKVLTYQLAIASLVLVLAISGCKTKCPIPSCHVRMEHRHPSADADSTIFRGMPWCKPQNPKVGQCVKIHKEDFPERIDPKANVTSKPR